MSGLQVVRSPIRGTSLGVAKITGAISTTNVEASPADAAGLSVTFVGGTRPVCVRFTCTLAYNLTAARAVGVRIVDVTAGGTFITSGGQWSGSAAEYGPMVIEEPQYTLPAVGSRTIKVQYWSHSGSGTANFASVGAAHTPIIASLQVIEV